jgi:hypothetical protein
LFGHFVYEYDRFITFFNYVQGTYKKKNHTFIWLTINNISLEILFKFPILQIYELQSKETAPGDKQNIITFFPYIIYLGCIFHTDWEVESHQRL